MKNRLAKAIQFFSENPKTIFLLDSFCAFISTILLFGVLRNFSTYFGLPKLVLSYLSAIALALCIYSALCFFKLKTNYKPFLQALCLANLLYCMLTLTLMLIHKPNLTPPGKAYFMTEILLIMVLVYLESKVAAKLTKNEERPNPLL